MSTNLPSGCRVFFTLATFKNPSLGFNTNTFLHLLYALSMSHCFSLPHSYLCYSIYYITVITFANPSAPEDCEPLQEYAYNCSLISVVPYFTQPLHIASTSSYKLREWMTQLVLCCLHRCCVCTKEGAGLEGVAGYKSLRTTDLLCFKPDSALFHLFPVEVEILLLF